MQQPNGDNPSKGSRNDFRRLHFIVEYGPDSAMLCFEHSLDLEVVTIGHGRGVLNINNDTAATGGTSQKECRVFAAAT